jgi:hypothetical protein
LPKNEGDLSIEEKLKDQDSWQNSSRSTATIHAANRCGQLILLLCLNNFSGQIGFCSIIH